MHDHGPDPGLILALALTAGIAGHALGRWLRLPSIVPLLALGVLLGPDGVGLVNPTDLGPILPVIVGFAVAIILFEGALHLDIARVRREGRTIQLLVTVGAAVTMLGAALATRALMDWSWPVCLLFGSLVIVTGPTVIGPLLRRMNVRSNLATILEGEGIFGDAIGATAAVVTLEIVLTASGDGLGDVAGRLGARLGIGMVVGILLGVAVLLALRYERWLPEGLLNVAVLALTALAFGVSNAAVPETGIITVVVGGLVAGNIGHDRVEELRLFKQQLTLLMIGLLFVLLAADVRMQDVKDLGVPGALVVVILMLVVRPLNILSSTVGSELTWRERGFLSWMAPRGIVAAAVASLFVQSMEAVGLEGGRPLRALVFLVIAATVVVQGSTGVVLARWLRVTLPARKGWGILGASQLGLTLAKLLKTGGKVVILDSSPQAADLAATEGQLVVQGNALDEATLGAAGVDTWAGAVAVTTNEEVNLLFVQHCRESGVPRALAALRHRRARVTPELVAEAGGEVLFGKARRVDAWSLWLESGAATVEAWVAGDKAQLPALETDDDAPGNRLPVLPLVMRRGTAVEPVSGATKLRGGDVVSFAVLTSSREAARKALVEAGWSAEPEKPATPPA